VTQQKHSRNRFAVMAALVLSTTLAACSSGVPAQTNVFEYVLTVSVPATETAVNLEQRYAGQMLVFRPESGFAILGVNQAPATDDLAVQGFELNSGVFGAPESQVSAEVGLDDTAMAAGWSTWGGGWSTWGGGWSTWGGGGSSLAPSENQAAWGKIRLAQAQKLAPNLGAGVIVAVIDSGIDLTHSVFKGRLAPSANWKDFVDNDATPQDVVGTKSSDYGYGHGTSVAGIVLQIAPKATILPIRVLKPDGSGDLAAVTSGLDWAVAKGAKIINLSLGSTSSSSAINTVIANATKKGVMVITSAGNYGAEKMTHPASRTHGKGDNHTSNLLMSVSSVNNSDIVSSFSNYGAPLELLAPGEAIFGPAPGNKLGAWYGTSMAAPMVTGGLTLALGQPSVGKTPAALQVAIGTTADSIDALNRSDMKNKLGYGRINLERFLTSIGLK
jgi:thermitase